MKNKPGISWGPDRPVNLVEFRGRWYAIYYHPDGFHEIIRDFGPVEPFGLPREVEKLMTWWNYNTDRLCPMVKADIDATS